MDNRFSSRHDANQIKCTCSLQGSFHAKWDHLAETQKRAQMSTQIELIYQVALCRILKSVRPRLFTTTNDLLVENLQGWGGGGEGGGGVINIQNPSVVQAWTLASGIGSSGYLCKPAVADQCVRSAVVQVWIASIELWPQEMLSSLEMHANGRNEHNTRACTSLKAFLVPSRSPGARAFVIAGLQGFTHTRCFLCRTDLHYGGQPGSLLLAGVTVNKTYLPDTTRSSIVQAWLSIKHHLQQKRNISVEGLLSSGGLLSTKCLERSQYLGSWKALN